MISRIFCFSLLAMIAVPASVFAETPTAPVASKTPMTLVPLPAKVKQGDGFFTLSPSTAIIASSSEEQHAAKMLASWLRPVTGLPLPIRAQGADPAIRFSRDSSLSGNLGREGYLLDCTPQSVKIRAAEMAGLFYGAQTFRQLLPPAAFRKGKATGIAWRAAAMSIEDKPRLGWRGFMLDTSRHFFPYEYLKQVVDDMATQKLNLLHLHLTDDDGWRMEIKKYPLLTEVGAWRGTACKLPNTRQDESHARYGGFYSQKQLKELVAYAKARNIEIMPEIDLPGHSLAIVTSYPETLPSKLSEANSVQGYKANAISPAKEASYRMVDDIIAEMATIFPFPYIHIGGDEVNHKIWEACPEIKALMEKEKLGNLHQVQVYFTKRLETILAKHHKKMIGWQEILDSRLSKDTGIMAWLGPGPAWHAARNGQPGVLAAGDYCYYDMGNPGGEDEPPSHWWAGLVSLQKAYSFNPLPPEANLDAKAQEKLLGMQAALFSEFVRGWESKSGWLTLKDEAECANYKVWPRICAAAEVAWTPQERREYTDFTNRLKGQYYRMAEAGRKFRLETPTAELKQGQIRINPPFPGATVYYTTDGSDPFKNPKAKTWAGELLDSRYRGSLAMRSAMPAYSIISPLTRGATVAPAGNWDVAKWEKDKLQELVFPVSDHIAQPGRWKIRMAKTRGSDGLVVDRVELRAAGKTIATGNPVPNGFVADISQPAPKDLELAVTAHFTGEKADAKGNVLIERLTGTVIPGMTVETRVPLNGTDFQASNLLDGDQETVLWTSRPMETDETITWVFPEEIPVKAISVQTGSLVGAKDQLLDAVLEISTDGKSFTKAAGFIYGAATAEKLGGKRLKAVRLRATGKSPGWVIVQDLRIAK